MKSQPLATPKTRFLRSSIVLVLCPMSLSSSSLEGGLIFVTVSEQKHFLNFFIDYISIWIYSSSNVYKYIRLIYFKRTQRLQIFA